MKRLIMMTLSLGLVFVGNMVHAVSYVNGKPCRATAEVFTAAEASLPICSQLINEESGAMGPVAMD